MNRANFEKLLGLERRRLTALAMLDQMGGTFVSSIALGGTYGQIDDNAIVAMVDTMLRKYLEDEIDMLTLAMAELGVEREEGA